MHTRGSYDISKEELEHIEVRNVFFGSGWITLMNKNPVEQHDRFLVSVSSSFEEEWKRVNSIHEQKLPADFLGFVI